MLSVVIATEESERALVPTLAALVAGATAGLIREVIVADAGSRDATAEVADVAGCRLLVAKGTAGARLKAAAAAARGAWFLFLRPGLVPDDTWTGEVARFIDNAQSSGRDHAAAFRHAPTMRRPGFIEIFALLRATLGPRSALPDQGLLISKRFYDQIGGHRDIAQSEVDLLRRVGRRRLVMLGSAASMRRA
jgi:glycosyltransferase involved in cell wall biosynthesis